MTYTEASESTELISKTRAMLEVKMHGLYWNDFISEVGEKEEYTIKSVLNWLGY